MSKSYSIIILFGITYWVSHLYAITPYWDGSDGNGQLANIFLHNIHGPYYLENAYTDGRKNFAATFHPALLYEIPRIIGASLNPFFNLENSDSINCAISLKVISALLQFIFFSYLICLGIKHERSRAPTQYWFCLTVVLVSCSPLALASSNEFQTDSFSGVFLIGGATLLLIASYQKKKDRVVSSALLLFSGILLGCGKNEWSLAFLIAIIAVYCIGILFRSKEILFDSTLLSVGLICGNLFSYEIDRTNYWYGCMLTFHMTTLNSALGTPSSYHFFSNLLQIFPYTVTIYILICFACAFSLVNEDAIAAQPLMLLFSSISLLCGYTLSSWPLVSRYFYPIVLLLLGLAFLLSQGVQSRNAPKWLVFPMLALLLVSNILFNYNLFQHDFEIRKWYGEHGALVLKPLNNDEAYLLDICFLLPNVDKSFVHAWIGDEAILYQTKWAHKKLKLDSISEYPPYTTMPPAFISGTHND